MQSALALIAPSDCLQAESIFLMHTQAMKGAKTSYMNMLLLLLRLRQACNHPWWEACAPCMYNVGIKSSLGST